MYSNNNSKKQIRFFTFSQYHNRRPITGSTNIRVHQLLEHWDEAELYTHGENPDVLIFQKVYCSPDYKFPANFEGKKILDICDPDWLDGRTQIKETCDAVDAVTCPTENLAKFLRQLTDKPVVVIPDRFELSDIPSLKPHKRKAQVVVWFGYRHNADLIKPALAIIKELKLKLMVVSDEDPFMDRTGKQDSTYQFIKYEEATIYQTLQLADFAILPDGNRPVDHFKSNNRTVKAILAGLPVAKTAEEVRSFMEAKNRQHFIHNNYDKIRAEYDVRLSVKEMKELINKL